MERPNWRALHHRPSGTKQLEFGFRKAKAESCPKKKKIRPSKYIP
jgi:hypothetical protein